METQFSSVSEAIYCLSTISDWVTFEHCALKATELCDRVFNGHSERVEPDEIPLSFADGRYGARA